MVGRGTLTNFFYFTWPYACILVMKENQFKLEFAVPLVRLTVSNHPD